MSQPSRTRSFSGSGNALLDAGDVVFDCSTDPRTVLHLARSHQQSSGDVAELRDYLAGP